MDQPIEGRGNFDASPLGAAERTRRREELGVDGRDIERARSPAGFRAWADAFADDALERLRAAGDVQLATDEEVDAARACLREGFLAMADDPGAEREPARPPAGASCESLGIPASACIKTYTLYVDRVGARLRDAWSDDPEAALAIHRAVAKCALFDMSFAMDRYQRRAALAPSARPAADELPRVGFKREALSRLSHELRTPLNAIVGFAELMHDGRVGAMSDEHREYVGDILTSARRMAELVTRFVDAADVESDAPGASARRTGAVTE